MSINKQTEKPQQTEVKIKAEDLPLYCPRPDMPLWSQHPRVYLEVSPDVPTHCPYCGTSYIYTGSMPHSH